MRSGDEQHDPVNSSAHRELQLLTEVDKTPVVTQRQLSLKVGIALGLTNVLLRNMVQKGYLRVSNASWKRRLYSLTPEGLAHKLRLTKGYISRVLYHYQSVRQTLREQMEYLEVNEESRVAVYGTNEFAELVFLGLRELGIEEIDVYSPDNPAVRRFLGMPVLDVSAIQSKDYDKVIVAVMDGSEVLNAELFDLGVPPRKVVTFFTNSKEGLGK